MGTSDGLKLVWHTEILPAKTKKALDYLSFLPWLKKSSWYLAGGTALALQVGHRDSLDLDFFSTQKNFSTKGISEKFPEKDWIADIVREGTVYGRLLGAKISFIAYPFFLPRQSFRQYGTIQVLDEKDIAVMKIVAISQRGVKRDFVDLYWYCQNRERLADILLRLPDQYPSVAHEYHHILKSLVYFFDAEADPMPRTFFKATWKEIKAYFQREVPRATRNFLDLH